MTYRRITKQSNSDWSALLGKINAYVPVRHRHILTRDGKLRLRVLLSGATTAIMLLSAGAIATRNAADMVSPHSSYARMQQLAAIEPASGAGLEVRDGAHDPAAVERLAAGQKRLQRYKREDGDTDTVAQASEEYAALAHEQQPQEIIDFDQPYEKVVKIGKGDTFGEVLQRAGLNAVEAHNAAQVMKKHYDPRALKLGQTVRLKYDRAQDDSGLQLASLHMDVDAVRSVNLSRDNNELGFKAVVDEKEILKKVAANRAQIETSLYGSALKAGLPRAVVAEAIRVYSYDIDFQRDVRRGDSLEVLYEQYETEDGRQVKTGDIIMARINVGGVTKTAYRFKNKNGDYDYFTDDGKTLRKALMRTPIDGARISSGFGVRRHPVLGYTKMHKGMDFAAPTGTPIFAAGDGTVERAGRFSSYGNYVSIRHNRSTKTAYAHMSRFAKGVTPGKRVKQGQVIGYVGTTGRSTGPHLHFEVIENGVQINPRNMKIQQGEALKGTELASFKEHIRKIDSQFANLTRSMKMASASQAAVN
ncbi:MAG TPA: peptidoglycan DD-metalloendopeptidase family protein [Micavibrio sp.]